MNVSSRCPKCGQKGLQRVRENVDDFKISGYRCPSCSAEFTKKGAAQ